MNKEFLTIFDFQSFRPLKDINGCQFGVIDHKKLGINEKNRSIFGGSKVIAYCRIFLKHWKVEDKYYSQIIFQEYDYYDLGDPHVSNVPISEVDINRDKYLKEVIIKKFPHMEVERIDSFISWIFEYCQNEIIQKKLFPQDNVRIDDSNTDKINNVQLVYPTSHLKCFNDLFEATGLIGDEYGPILKPVWYCLLSTLIAQTQLKLGSIVVDGRINLMISLPSGSGKTEIKRTMKQILEKIGKSYVEPTSFHPEQFVGKVIITNKKGERDFIPIKGYLSNDFVMIDEGKDLLTSPDATYAETRKYLRLALDQYPYNTITKKSVDIEQQNALAYEPHCCVCILVQPFHMDQEIVLAGDFRRLIISYIFVAGLDKNESYKTRIREKRDYERSVNVFSNFLDSINIPESFEFTEDAVDLFEELSILLIERGSNHSSKVKNFVNIMDFTFQNILLKFCAVQALQDNTSTIEPKHVELAFVDYAEILEHTYSFIENKILGSMDYGENWAGAVKKDQEILKWLHEKGATSKETSKVSIKDYKDKIMDLYNVTERQARRYKIQHEVNGWIKSKKINMIQKYGLHLNLKKNLRVMSEGTEWTRSLGKNIWK